MARKRWVTIASADDDVIGGEMIEWGGVCGAWSKVEDVPDVFYDIVELVEDCDHAQVEREEWDANMPGRSGVWHVVKTDDPEQLRREIRTRIAKILSESRLKIRKERLKRLAAD